MQHRYILLLSIVLTLTLGACGGVASLGESTQSGSSTETATYRIGAWNIQTFGRAKMAKPEVVPILVDVIRRYDLVVIQEVRDASETAIHELVTLLNDGDDPEYALVLGPRAGRTSHKEQYAFLYQTGRAKLLDQFVYEDGVEPYADTMAREPFVTRWNIGGVTLALVPAHTDPDDVPAELNALADATYTAITQWNDNDVLTLGDLNADCAYVRMNEWPGITLRTDPAFVWLIGDEVDTTTKATDCSYDRIIVTKTLIETVTLDHAGAFDFQAAFGLSNELTTDISDHYPIEVASTVR